MQVTPPPPICWEWPAAMAVVVNHGNRKLRIFILDQRVLTHRKTEKGRWDDGEKAWSSINHSVLSDLSPSGSSSYILFPLFLSRFLVQAILAYNNLYQTTDFPTFICVLALGAFLVPCNPISGRFCWNSHLVLISFFTIWVPRAWEVGTRP